MTKARRKELFFDTARVFDFPDVRAFVRLVKLTGDFAESVAFLTIGTIDREDSERTVIDAHGQGDAELIHQAIAAFDDYVSIERGKWIAHEDDQRDEDSSSYADAVAGGVERWTL
jgi:hypothetical protein